MNFSGEIGKEFLDIFTKMFNFCISHLSLYSMLNDKILQGSSLKEIS